MQDILTTATRLNADKVINKLNALHNMEYQSKSCKIKDFLSQYVDDRVRLLQAASYQCVAGHSLVSACQIAK
jgi:hypothetical protein